MGCVIQISLAILSDRPAMNKATTDKIDPWRAPIIVTQIPDTGLHRDLEADAAARKAMA